MELNPNVGRLPIQRIAITVPPDGWFHGIARALFDLYRQAMVDLGIAVFDVPVDAFLPPDTVRISALLSDLKAFHPDFAFGLPHGSYALLCRLPPSRDGSRLNLFTDVLDIPTICLWDHAPVELADQLLMPHPPDPGASRSGALETLRRVLTHPRLIHWSRDTGQTQIMKDLGFLLPTHVIHEMPPALPGFLPQRTQAGFPDRRAPSVSFVGRFYQERANYPHPALADLAEETIRTWINVFGQSLWEVLGRQITHMPAGLRQQLSLDPDQTYFWPYAHRLIVHQAQTSLRLKLLGAAKVPVACYSNLKMDLHRVPGNLLPVPTQVPYGPELASLFARHPITIDVLSPGFVHGYSHKQIHGFASGGFMLMNRKQDFVDTFGEAGAAVSYVDADDLGAKVDRFLSDPKHRCEMGDVIREKIAACFQLKPVLRRALDAAFRCAAAAGSNPNATKPCKTDQYKTERSVTTVMSLLPNIRSEPHWLGAGVHHGDVGTLISTGAEAWAYAAAIGIPPLRAMNEPHLRLSLQVEAGRIGLAALLEATGTLVSEQFVSPSAAPVTVTIELPREGVATVILRNTVGTTSRAIVLEASLCDHPVSTSPIAEHHLLARNPPNAAGKTKSAAH